MWKRKEIKKYRSRGYAQAEICSTSWFSWERWLSLCSWLSSWKDNNDEDKDDNHQADPLRRQNRASHRPTGTRSQCFDQTCQSSSSSSFFSRPSIYLIDIDSKPVSGVDDLSVCRLSIGEDCHWLARVRHQAGLRRFGWCHESWHNHDHEKHLDDHDHIIGGYFKMLVIISMVIVLLEAEPIICFDKKRGENYYAELALTIISFSVIITIADHFSSSPLVIMYH